MKSFQARTALITAAMGLSACSNSRTNQDGAPRQTVQVAGKTLFKSYDAQAKSDTYKDFIAHVGGLSLAEDYKSALQNSNNDTLQIDGHAFDRIHDVLVVRAPAAAEIAGVFPTRQEYWDYISFDPTESIDQAGFEEGLLALEKSFRLQYQTPDEPNTLLSNDDAIAIEKARLVMQASGKSMGLMLADGGGDGGGGAGSAGFSLTWRESMGKGDPLQCYKLGSYDAPSATSEKIGGRWIAGVDGATLGTNHDATPSDGGGPKCGDIFAITNKDGVSQPYVVGDRIWQNDGAGNCGGWTADQKSQADGKTSCPAAGSAQIDIAQGAKDAQFPGGTYQQPFTVEWGK